MSFNATRIGFKQNEIKSASIRGIAAATFGLRKQSKKFERVMTTEDQPITGNPHDNTSGLANNLGNIDFNSKTSNPLIDLLSLRAAKMADITIHHHESNLVTNSKINQAIKQSNELVKLANLSFSYQQKQDFALCKTELKLIKSVGLQLPRLQIEDNQYFRSNEFRTALKDKALKILNKVL